VFVRRDGNALSADFVDPDGDNDAVLVTPAVTGTRISAPPSLFDMMRTPSGGSNEVAALAAAEEPIAQRIESDEWSALKAQIASEINAAGFWSRPDRFETLVRLELMDRNEVAAETAAPLQSRLARQTAPPGKGMRELIARLAMQIHLVNEGLKDLDQKASAEVALVVEPAFVSDVSDSADGEADAWCAEIARMYRSWAENRNMNMREIEAIQGIAGPALLVAGFGAHRVLAREVGLHNLEKSEAAGMSGRLTAQVLIATLPLGNVSTAELAASFSKVKRACNIVRRYRRGPTPLVRKGDGTMRSGKVEDVLRGNFDLFAHEPA
jgi:hypothetical protein